MNLNDIDGEDDDEYNGNNEIDIDPDNNQSEKLSDQDVLNLPILYLKPEDLKCCKRLKHCKHQNHYLKKLIERWEQVYMFSFLYLKN